MVLKAGPPLHEHVTRNQYYETEKLFTDAILKFFREKYLENGKHSAIKYQIIFVLLATTIFRCWSKVGIIRNIKRKNDMNTTRNISVTTDVFAAIWARRQDGEDTENAILHRIFKCKQKNGHEQTESGVYDKRNDVFFPEGFMVFRNYKGRNYSAIANNGVWRLSDTNVAYPSLNRLNREIAVGAENVWVNWKYKDSKGLICLIDALRPPQ